MIEIKRIQLKSSCNCGKSQLILEFNFPLEKEYLQKFVDNNFIESKSYTNLGILYLEDTNLVAIGPFGSNRLQIRCKNANCDNSLVILENILKIIKT